MRFDVGSLVSVPPQQLVGNHEFVDNSVWTLFDYTTIAGGLLKIDGEMLTKGGAWQVIDTKINQVYRFEIEVTFKGGDPAEWTFLYFGTGGSQVHIGSCLTAGVYTFIAKDPDGTGLISLETWPNADDNIMHFDYLSCKLYADIVAENLEIPNLKNTFSDSWILVGNKFMMRLVNERNSVNSLYIVNI